MNIVIPDDYQNAVEKLDSFKLLKDHEVIIYNDACSDVDLLAKRFNEAEVLVLIRERTKITEPLLARLPKLKLISQTGKISHHIDLAACNKYHIAVCEGLGSPIAPAELTFNLILNARRQLQLAIENMRMGLWQTNIGKALNGQILGIWGYGKIGKLVAKYAVAFGMKIMVWGSEQSRETAKLEGHLVTTNKEDFFRTADVISLHLRLVESTIHIIKEKDLALMKPDALLVNVSRAELIEKDALINALYSGRPGFAAVDVYENEPVYDVNYPLLKMPNVICTPHLGYVEQNSYELYFSKTFQNIISFASGNPQNIVNREILTYKKL